MFTGLFLGFFPRLGGAGGGFSDEQKSQEDER